MKKIFAALSTCVLALCLLVSCGSKMGAVKKALEKAEYTVVAEEIKEEKSVIKSVALVKGKLIPVGILVELGSTSDIDEAIKELQKDPEYKDILKLVGNDAKQIQAKLEELGLINKNVVLITIDPKAVDAFKNA